MWILSCSSGTTRTHVLEDVPAGALNMACNEFGCLVRMPRLYMRDKLAMLAKDCGTPGEREVETPTYGSKHFAMLPPKLGGMAVVVLLVHYRVKGGVQFAVSERVGEVVLFNQALDAFEFSNVLDGGHIHEPFRQCRLDQDPDLIDVPNEILIYGPDTRSAVGDEGDKALPAQQLQSLAHGVGRGAAIASMPSGGCALKSLISAKIVPNEYTHCSDIT
jgi:hypothetical protein